MYLIVGLGNPGLEYRKTFHNVGFMALDVFCENNNLVLSKSKCNSLIYEGNVLGKKVIIAKPQTYMNNSGVAVSQLKSKYKPEKILIIYDDIDLPIGSFRFREKGSSGTHNGMRSVIKEVGSEDIQRIRIGIKPKRAIYNLADYVLSDGKIEEQEILQQSIEEAVDFLTEHIKKDFIKN